VSAEMGECSGCGASKRLSTRGLVYTHDNADTGVECEGSRKPVNSIVSFINNEADKPTSEEFLKAVDEFRESLRSTKKRTWRQRLRDRFRRAADRMDDALDVFDDD
jgi:hypothetical protein